MLLLGGTASIVGEDSCHVGNVAAQIDELLTNMAVLIAQTGVDQDGALSRLTEARIYVVDPADAELVESAIAARAGDQVRMQTARVADLPAGADGRSRRSGCARRTSWDRELVVSREREGKGMTLRFIVLSLVLSSPPPA